MASMKARVIAHINQIISESTDENLAKMVERLQYLGAPQSLIDGAVASNRAMREELPRLAQFIQQYALASASLRSIQSLPYAEQGFSPDALYAVQPE